MKKENDMKIKPKAKPVNTDPVSDAVKMAAANFMILSVSVGLFKGKKELKEAGAIAAKQAGAEKGSVIVPLLGHHQAELEKVVSQYAKIRTIFGELGIRYQPPEKLVFVPEVIEVLGKLAKQQVIAEASLAAFLPEYDRFVKESLPSQGTWAREVKRHLPTADELAAKFYITIHDPKPIPAMDMERYGCVPTSTMGKIVTASNEALASKLEAAKRSTLDSALEAVEKVVTQLSKEKPRLHQAVIEDAQNASAQLRNLATGYDGDIRLRSIADMIDKEVINVDKATHWHDNISKKQGARDAAKKTATNLKRLKKAVPVAPQPSSDPQLVIGGLLADIL